MTRVAPTLLLLAVILGSGCTSARYADDEVQDRHGVVNARPTASATTLVTSSLISAEHGPVYALVETPPAVYRNGSIVLTSGREWHAVTGEPWRYYDGADAQSGAAASARESALRLEAERQDLSVRRANITETIRSEEVKPLAAELAASRERERTRETRILAAIAATPESDPLEERAVAMAIAESRHPGDTTPLVRPVDRDQLLAAMNTLNRQLAEVTAQSERAQAAATAAEAARLVAEQTIKNRESSAASDRDRAAKSNVELEQLRTDLAASAKVAAKANAERDQIRQQYVELEKRFADLAQELAKQPANSDPAPAPAAEGKKP